MSKRTPLYHEHVKLGARMIEFAGWDMPVSYSGIIEEHLAVRNSTGLFDIGHMGIVEISGDGALPFLQKLVTNDASKLQAFRAQYSMLCNEKGGVVDDILVYRLPEKFVVVVNAANTAKALALLNQNADKSVEIDHRTDLCLLSLQGPKSELILSPVCDINLKPLKHNSCSRAKVLEKECLVSRTGYTGEDGFEFFVSTADAAVLWKAFLEKGATPCGLGARDSLRIEAGLPLYGHEYSEESTPVEAGYGWAVKLDKGEFTGRNALARQKKEGIGKRLVGISLKEKAIPRSGYKVFSDEGLKNTIGEITSGTYSPLMNKAIAMAYVDPRSASAGSPAWIDIRGRSFAGELVSLPFYKRKP